MYHSAVTQLLDGWMTEYRNKDKTIVGNKNYTERARSFADESNSKSKYYQHGFITYKKYQYIQTLCGKIHELTRR